MILDLILEIRIEYHFWRALQAKPWSRMADKHFKKMAELIGRRSPGQIERLGAE